MISFYDLFHMYSDLNIIAMLINNAFKMTVIENVGGIELRREEIELLAPAGSYEGFEAIGRCRCGLCRGAALARGPMRRISERKSFCVPLILLISMAGNFI